MLLSSTKESSRALDVFEGFFGLKKKSGEDVIWQRNAEDASHSKSTSYPQDHPQKKVKPNKRAVSTKTRGLLLFYTFLQVLGSAFWCWPLSSSFLESHNLDVERPFLQQHAAGELQSVAS